MFQSTVADTVFQISLDWKVDHEGDVLKEHQLILIVTHYMIQSTQDF